MTDGFLRDHARLPHGPERMARERWVNVLGDHVETLADWACDIFETNAEHTKVCDWLSPDKTAARQPNQRHRAEIGIARGRDSGCRVVLRSVSSLPVKKK